MCESSNNIPYLLQLKDAVNAIHLSENEVNNIEIPRGTSLTQSTNFTIIPSYDPGIEQIYIQPGTQVIQKTVDSSMEIESENIANSEINFIYEIVYPEQLNLKPVYNLKRGRPKKKKVVQEQIEPPKIVKPAPRTRSGRLVKFPKYIEKDFKKVEIVDNPLDSEETDLKTSEFIRFVEDKKETKKTKEIQLEFHQRRRKISAQYRCPKCNKAYLGKFRMIQHIKKYPDHGPLPHNDLNFDVWNYLVDITQKCPPAQRGIKFCEELTNLLHNVLLLTSALFKKAELNKNHVDVDKVLGNAIGLPPGPYKFNDSELYKDVTVLKLITNSDFFKPINRNEDSVANSKKTAKEECNLKDEHKGSGNSESSSNKKNYSNNMGGTGTVKEKEDLVTYFGSQQSNGDNIFHVNKTKNHSYENRSSPVTNNQIVSTIHNYEKNGIETSSPDNFIQKNQPLDNRLSVHTDLLSENSLLNLPNLRNSVDELILSSVDSGTNLLDNSTSSDEVMNVDQFVNERFKKITEPEIELGGTGLNLDLPSLDLFQFHTS